MPTLIELLEQKRALEAQIDELRTSERQDAIDRIKTIMAQYEITIDDLLSKKRPPARYKRATSNSGDAKYRDPNTGLTWNGRGRKPNWLDQERAEEFLIQD